jgi:hypothetical protein
MDKVTKKPKNFYRFGGCRDYTEEAFITDVDPVSLSEMIDNPPLRAQLDEDYNYGGEHVD